MANFHRRGKNSNKPVIKQILDKIPNHIFRAQINKHKSDKGCHKYKCFDQSNIFKHKLIHVLSINFMLWFLISSIFMNDIFIQE